MYDIKSCFQIVCVPPDLAFLGKALDYHNDFDFIFSQMKEWEAENCDFNSVLALCSYLCRRSCLTFSVPILGKILGKRILQGSSFAGSDCSASYVLSHLVPFDHLLLSFAAILIVMVSVRRSCFYGVGLLAPRPTLLSHPGLGSVE